MGATDVKRACGFGPVASVDVCRARCGLFFGIFLAAAGYVAVSEGSCWSARSRVAARTNELDADER